MTLDHNNSRHSSNVFNESFINTTGIEMMDPDQINDLTRHGHSDLDTGDDDDPYYEYNMCNEYSKIELKDVSKNKYREIKLSNFFTSKKKEPTHDINMP